MFDVEPVLKVFPALGRAVAPRPREGPDAAYPEAPDVAEWRHVWTIRWYRCRPGKSGSPVESLLLGRVAMMDLRLFVYGTMMTDQRDHAVLEAAELLGRSQTAPSYTLVDIDVYAAITSGGRTAIHGELYRVEPMLLARIDLSCQVPHLFQRRSISLADGTAAETHIMSMEQVRGKRRLGHGNWLERFAPRHVPHRDLAFAEFARQRSQKR